MLRRWGVPVLLCGVLSAFIFRDALFFGRAFFYRDVLHYYWPTREVAAAAFRALELPQWNPMTRSGHPLLADLHAAVLYPFNLLFILTSFPTAYSLSLFFHHVLGGVGLYAFLRKLLGKESSSAETASAAGAIIWMLSGYMLGLSVAGPLMAGAAYVPWALLVLASERPWRRRVAGLALVFALQALTGDPQSALFSAMAGGAFWAIVKRDRETLKVFAAAGVLALLLAAVQLLPSALLLRETTRGQGGAQMFAEQWTMHPLRVLELVAPFPFGGYLWEPRYWAWFSVDGPANFPFALSIYLGAAALPLVLIGLGKNRSTAFAVFLVFTGVLLALGKHIGTNALLVHVPPFSFFRYPEKYVLLTTLGWAILVALGLARVRLSQRLAQRRMIVIAAAGAVLGVAYLFTQIESASAGFAGRMLGWSKTAGEPTTVLQPASDALQLAFGMFILSGFAIILARRRPERVSPMVLIALVLAVDLALSNSRVLWTEDRLLYDDTPELVSIIRASQPPQTTSRVLRDPVKLSRAGPRGTTLVTLSDGRSWELATLKSNVGAVFAIEEAGGYGAVVYRRTLALWQTLYLRPAVLGGTLNACLFLFLPAAPETNDSRLELLHEWPALKLAMHRSRACVSRLHGAGQIIGAPNLAEAVKALGDLSFDPAQSAVVEGIQDATVPALVVEDVRIERSSASASVLAGSGGGFLVFATSFGKGWTVTIDGVPAQLLPTNVATMGVAVPEGRHQVRFAYSAPGLLLGAVLSFASLLLLGLLWFVRPRGRAQAPG